MGRLEKAAEIRLYGIIGADITGQQIAADLASIEDGRDLVVRINSRGGDVFEGVAILNALRGYDGKVTTIVDGLAASAASFIAMAGSEIVMNRNSEMMIHNGHSLAIGGAEDMRKVADNLERTNANIAAIYAERAGGTPEEWRAAMSAETWYSAEEAVKAGLADRVEAIKDRDAAKVKAHFDLTVFNHAGRDAAPAPQFPAPTQAPQPVEAEVTDEGEEPIVATLSESALTKLGLDADADEGAIEAAIEKLTAEKTDEPSVADLPAVAAKFGAVVLDKTVHDQLMADAQAGAQARAQQLAEQREATIQAALRDGKISPASADTWRTELAKAPDSVKALLDSMPSNHAVPTGELGHGVSREDSPEDDDKKSVFAMITGRNFGEDI